MDGPTDLLIFEPKIKIVTFTYNFTWWGKKKWGPKRSQSQGNKENILRLGPRLLRVLLSFSCLLVFGIIWWWWSSIIVRECALWVCITKWKQMINFFIYNTRDILNYKDFSYTLPKCLRNLNLRPLVCKSIYFSTVLAPFGNENQ